MSRSYSVPSPKEEIGRYPKARDRVEQRYNQQKQLLNNENEQAINLQNWKNEMTERWRETMKDVESELNAKTRAKRFNRGRDLCYDFFKKHARTIPQSLELEKESVKRAKERKKRIDDWERQFEQREQQKEKKLIELEKLLKDEVEERKKEIEERELFFVQREQALKKREKQLDEKEKEFLKKDAERRVKAERELKFNEEKIAELKVEVNDMLTRMESAQRTMASERAAAQRAMEEQAAAEGRRTPANQKDGGVVSAFQSFIARMTSGCR